MSKTWFTYGRSDMVEQNGNAIGILTLVLDKEHKHVDYAIRNMNIAECKDVLRAFEQRLDDVMMAMVNKNKNGSKAKEPPG